VDCGRLASAETADGLRSLWGDENLREKLIDAMAFDDRGIKGARQRAEESLMLFVEGFEESRNKPGLEGRRKPQEKAP
jgi:hypothetical protein